MHDPTATPFRDVKDFTPLITAAQGFPAFEELACSAQQNLWLSFRIFDPKMRLKSRTDLGENWLDLLRNRLQDGVRIRVLLSDFDPVVGTALHEGSVRAAEALNGLKHYGDIETLIVRHEARVGKGIRFGLWLPVSRALAKQRHKINNLHANLRADVFAHRPGLWRYLKAGADGKIIWRLPRLPRIYPATFHQKIAVADHHTAIIGGLDIDERRFDTLNHDREGKETWQDVAVKITGDVVPDISSHIAACWNHNRLRMRALRREQAKDAPINGVLLADDISSLPQVLQSDRSATGAGIRFLRTLSLQKRRVGLQFSPVTAISEIEQAHVAAIQSAESAIYIETQFFRSQVIAEALVKAAAANSALNLVMILPAAPEEVAFDDTLGVAERMGEKLQADCLRLVSKAFGERATILSPVRQVASDSDARDQLHGAEIIYVHSKVLVVDQSRCIVGSANLNGRSMKWDTEAAVECTDGRAVSSLRTALIQHWLPEEPEPVLTGINDMARHWAALAKENTRQAPEKRAGFLVPYNPTPAQKAGVPLPGVPDEVV